MNKKFLKFTATLFSMITALSLILPIFSTYITGAEAWNMVVRGYNLIEFSPWGSVVFVAPLILVGLIFSDLKNKVKTVGMLALALVDSFALNASVIATYKWVSEQATGAIELQFGLLIYVIFMLLAEVSFFLSIKCRKGAKINMKDFFLKKEHNIEPVEFEKQKFYLHNRLHDFVKYRKDGEDTTVKSVICFANEDGYFAMLNDGDKETYCDIEPLENENAIGFLIDEMPTGLYGIFYEDFDFKDETSINIRKFDEIDEGEAEVWIPQETGGFVKDAASVKLLDVDNIRLKTSDDEFDTSMIGSAVIQGCELIAIVTGYDSEKREYICISAEMIAIDLCRKIYEHRVFMAMNARKISR